MQKSRISIGGGIAVTERPEVKPDSGGITLTFHLHQSYGNVKLVGPIALAQ